MLQINQKSTYLYQGEKVTVVSVFNYKQRPTAVVKDEKGNIYPFKQDLLKELF